MTINIFDTGYTNHVDADVHPNGKSIYLAINKTESKDRVNFYNLKIVEVDRTTKRVVRIIREYNQGIDTPGPIGYCTVKCLPDGALFVGLAITSTKDTSQVVAAFDIIENVIPVFTPTSTNTTTPPIVGTVDAQARADALTALTQSAKALQQMAAISSAITAAQARADDAYTRGTVNAQRLDALNSTIAQLPNKVYVWQNIVDRIATEINALNTSFSSVFESPTFHGYINSIAQNAILDALNYAHSTPDKSALRALIREVIAEK